VLGSIRLLCSDMSDRYVLLVCRCHTDVYVLEEVQHLPCGAVCDERVYLVRTAWPWNIRHMASHSSLKVASVVT